MRGMVVFSFALRSEPEEPSPCNKRLARAAEHINDIMTVRGDRPLIVAQWETARQLEMDGYGVAHIVRLLPDGRFLGSEEVWEEAREVFKAAGITTVVLVAHPFLHLRKVRWLAEADGFTVETHPVRGIGFDRKSMQWWTRGPLRLTWYAARQLWRVRRQIRSQALSG